MQLRTRRGAAPVTASAAAAPERGPLPEELRPEKMRSLSVGGTTKRSSSAARSYCSSASASWGGRDAGVLDNVYPNLP